MTEALDAWGRPNRLRVGSGPEPKDCGSEFAGRMLDQWAYLNVEIE